MSEPATFMETRDLEVHFRSGRKIARGVDNVSLEWNRGEILGVVGESGSGKSTLARALLGLVKIESGSVALDGADVRGRAELRALRRRVQMIFQDPYQTLNPRMRVGAIVAEPLVVQDIPRDQHAQRVEQALNDVGMEPARFMSRHPHELSGGQRQRVAIAATLVLEPDGIICDEPVSMLDVSVRSQILHVLLDLKSRRNLALLFITHDLSLAWALCDRIAVMYLGRIVEQGNTRDVIENPGHPYTQALVAAVPSVEPGAAQRRQLLEGELPDAANVPSGCRFHPRCPHRFEPCDKVDPPLFAAGGEPEHRAACLLLDPGRSESQPGAVSPPAPLG